MTPQEIVTRFPVGTILELSPEAKQKIRFFAEISEAIDLVQRKLHTQTEGFRQIGKEITGEMIGEIVGKVMEEQPFEGFCSIALANGWNGPESFITAQHSATVIHKLVWAVIYADVVKNTKMDHKTWMKIHLALLEKPPGSGILIKGYNFSETDFGLDKHNGKDRCPDFPPDCCTGFSGDDSGNNQ